MRSWANEDLHVASPAYACLRSFMVISIAIGRWELEISSPRANVHHAAAAEHLYITAAANVFQ